MTYRIEGAQGFSVPADSPEDALTKATAAAAQFSPIRITGPQGQMTFGQLRAVVEAGKRRA